MPVPHAFDILEDAACWLGMQYPFHCSLRGDGSRMAAPTGVARETRRSFLLGQAFSRSFSRPKKHEARMTQSACEASKGRGCAWEGCRLCGVVLDCCVSTWMHIAGCVVHCMPGKEIRTPPRVVVCLAKHTFAGAWSTKLGQGNLELCFLLLPRHVLDRGSCAATHSSSS